MNIVKNDFKKKIIVFGLILDLLKLVKSLELFTPLETEKRVENKSSTVEMELVFRRFRDNFQVRNQRERKNLEAGPLPLNFF